MPHVFLSGNHMGVEMVMIVAWAMQRSRGLVLVGSTLAGGFAVAEVLLQQNGFGSAMVIFSIGLAALVGTGKLASP
jgi:hypothetical protein